MNFHFLPFHDFVISKVYLKLILLLFVNNMDFLEVQIIYFYKILKCFLFLFHSMPLTTLFPIFSSLYMANIFQHSSIKIYALLNSNVHLYSITLTFKHLTINFYSGHNVNHDNQLRYYYVIELVHVYQHINPFLLY